MDYAKIVKKTRIELKLTQNDLAHLAKVGLATVQNIEAGKANLEVITLEKILKPLGMELSTKTRALNWQTWINLGVLLIGANQAISTRPEKATLLEQFSNINPILKTLIPQSREALAFLNFLLAIADHYPSIFNKLSPAVQKKLKPMMRQNLNPKLRRISLAKLQEYL